MREELENLINEKLDGITPSLEEVYSPVGEEIAQEIETQNQKIASIKEKKEQDAPMETKETKDVEK